MARCLPVPARTIALGLLVVLGTMAPAVVRADQDHRSVDPALARIEAELRAGRIDPRGAALLQLQRIFAPASLPSDLRTLANAPVKCATPSLIEISRLAASDDEVRARLQEWTQPRTTLARGTVYASPQGRFAITYETTGTNAVPTADVSPANGVPDFVERIGQFLEESWTLQVDQLGFVAPDISQEPYPVSFQEMGAYGYTTDQGVGTTGTRIVLNNDFVGFPANEDPEGDQIGAMRVTCVHELRHASQFATSGWSEAGLWVEVDATWIEDIGYDFVNDYYNYLGSGSPISSPTLPLDSGGSGSYEDCVWQHYLSERFSVGVMQKFWLRRGSGTVEDVMQTYDWAMQQYGGSVLENFVEFAAWNHATGARALVGVGYEEAAGYPTSPISNTAVSVPASFTYPIQRYSARFFQVSGFTQGESGVVVITVNRAPGSPLRARAVVMTHGGQRIVEPLVLGGAQDVIELATPLQDVASVTVVVAHGGIGIGTANLTLDVGEAIRPPMPSARVDIANVNFRVAAGTIASRGFTLRNAGEAGSSLQYLAVDAVTPPPPAAPSTAFARDDDGAPRRSIAGSFLSVDTAVYQPGSTADRVFTVANASRDFEWLAGVEITLPVGVTVLGSTDFVGGTSGPLVTNGATGDSVTVIWSDLNGGWGNVRNGQTASATLSLAFDVTLVGDLVLPYRILGDGYGADPHEVLGAILLDGPEVPVFEVLAPTTTMPVVTGSTFDVQWIAGFAGDVLIELSRDGGANWESLATVPATNGNFAWDVAGSGGAQALLRLSEVGGPNSTLSAPFFLLESLPWMTVAPATGAIAANTETNLQLTFDATNLAPGVYQAELFVFHNGADSPLRVPVTLEVTETGTPADPSRVRYVVLGAAPNPFNPATSVRFELFSPAEVEIVVFDPRGRRVRTLSEGTLPAGIHSVRWDSRDRGGRDVSSGVYFCRIVIDGEVTTTKLTLSK